MDKVVIYARVSDKRRQEERNQIPECKKFAKRMGWEPEVIQEKISAFKNPNRESLNRLLGYDHVIVWSYDRLQRNRKKFVEMMRYFSHKGVQIHSVKEQWLEELHKIPSPWDEIIYNFAVQLIGWMAEEESRKRSERTKAGMAEAKNRGVKLGRRAKKMNFEKVWAEYERQGSINRTAKLVPYGYGTVYDIITNDIHDQDTWEEFIENRRPQNTIEKG